MAHAKCALDIGRIGAATVNASDIVGILLAAGSGSRFGGDKLLARLTSGEFAVVNAPTGSVRIAPDEYAYPASISVVGFITNVPCPMCEVPGCVVVVFAMPGIGTAVKLPVEDSTGNVS